MQQPVSTENGNKLPEYQPVPITVDKPPFPYKNILLTSIKILFGLALLILSIQGIHIENLMAGIRSANLSWMALAILSVLLSLFLKVWRWAIFIKNYEIQSSIARIYSAYFVGQATNILLPLRAGELVRTGYFADNTKTLPGIASTIVLEKYMDLVALTGCGILVSLKFSLENILNLRGFLIPLTVFITLLLLAVILFGPTVWGRIRDTMRLPKGMIVFLDKWVQASQWLKNPRQVLPGVLLTIFIWGVMWLTNILLFKSIGLALGGTAAGLVLISVYVGLLPALMPGNIGPFYFFARLALIPFGIIQDQAITFAVILHAIVTLPPLLGGAIGLLMRPKRIAAP